MTLIQHPALSNALSIPADADEFSRDELIALYWHHHPRFRFLKMCPRQSRFFDIGAGSGGLAFWKDWQTPPRVDIEMHGCDLFPAQFADRYTGFHVMDFDGNGFPYPDNHFDAALSSHVIEHLRHQEGLAAELARVLKPGGTVYIETPTDESCNFPNREFFIANGCPTTTINFFDDHTHTTTVSRQKLSDLFLKKNFSLLEAGTIKLPYLEDLMLAKAVARNDQELGSYGLWSKLGFAHYAIFRKPPP